MPVVVSTYPKDPAIRAELAKMEAAKTKAYRVLRDLELNPKSDPNDVADAKAEYKSVCRAYKQARIDAANL